MINHTFVPFVSECLTRLACSSHEPGSFPDLDFSIWNKRNIFYVCFISKFYPLKLFMSSIWLTLLILLYPYPHSMKQSNYQCWSIRHKNDSKIHVEHIRHIIAKKTKHKTKLWKKLFIYVSKNMVHIKQNNNTTQKLSICKQTRWNPKPST